MKDLGKLRAYIKKALRSFERDPADSKFQEGYKAALEEILRNIE